MSAKQAAEALIAHDPHLVDRVRQVEDMGYYHPDRTMTVKALLRDTIAAVKAGAA